MLNKTDKRLVVQIIKKSPDLMNILKVIAQLNLPQGALAAGSIRNTVWQVLSHQPIELINDVDVVYFDPRRPRNDDQIIQASLIKRMPDYQWQVKNEAYMHYYDFKDASKFTSIEDAISHFVETPTCIGAYLKGNDIEIIAPYGLTDLIQLKCRPIPMFQNNKTCLSIYQNRIQRKNWKKRWPNLAIINS
ncbi:MAG: nucleotidyltransferase [Lactobacillus sp.]|nr:MAG: nucleotidyltransferase [Lactobacillus sp.]